MKKIMRDKEELEIIVDLTFSLDIDVFIQIRIENIGQHSRLVLTRVNMSCQ